MDLAFVAVNLTVPHPGFAELWELGVVVRRDDLGDREKRWLLRCEHLHTADREHLEVTGFHERHPQGFAVVADPELIGKIDREQIVRENLVEFAGELGSYLRGCTLIGRRVAEAEKVLETLLMQNGYSPSWSRQQHDIDTASLGSDVWMPEGTWPDALEEARQVAEAWDLLYPAAVEAAD